MHEDSPKMSVAQGLVASSSQAKNEIAMEVPEYEITCVETKSTENIEMELKISYVNPTSESTGYLLVRSVAQCGNVAIAFRAILRWS
ncbi:Nuclear hormone receptor FTZ-F1 [Papilio xuthus]|uniref:Nuclear hormone receptor FTZ-F1 n=1 Tax=Papilio xuthus TaxID=66420 RepID=A0A194PG05_PAPXU|nr:Nuclear hormone receptor FTZ-F1 [Papilio xuthus]